ncbi:phosphonate C-P lyase system protein PhnH [Paenibacillus koleovorans]|uniref:phosphonate C-P lyase system protein PhnH n=1 Tax=Paenibacillus koleovorans TaxID=121608 RepID=UPI000FD77453|nr:phosphonate C-P lyase system protein PhnH [Paenibacillus koleovorans]
MKLDFVHDIQTSYRKVVQAMARPGLVVDLAEEAGKLEPEGGCYPTTMLLAHMLLDTEVTFKVVSGEEAAVMTQFLNQTTYARAVETEKADYVFVLRDAVPEDVLHTLRNAKIGKLADPHHSATVIIEVESISEAQGHGRGLRLRGPGIQTASYVQLEPQPDWVELRAERNVEFPLGLDLLFMDAEHRLFALPRTTQVEREEAGVWLT